MLVCASGDDLVSYLGLTYVFRIVIAVNKGTKVEERTKTGASGDQARRSCEAFGCLAGIRICSGKAGRNPDDQDRASPACADRGTRTHAQCLKPDAGCFRRSVNRRWPRHSIAPTAQRSIRFLWQYAGSPPFTARD